jgi:hypothetical protein
MRLIFALSILLLATFAQPAQAVVHVTGTFNGQALPTCNNATGIAYSPSTNTIGFTCEDGITRSCTPSQTVTYTPGGASFSTLNVVCINGTEVGFVVDATVDGQNNLCSTASNIQYLPVQQSFSWSCTTNNFQCFPISSVVYNVQQRRVTLTCSLINPLIFSDGFE